MEKTSKSVALSVGQHGDCTLWSSLIKWIAVPARAAWAGEGAKRFCCIVRCACCGHQLVANQIAWQFKHAYQHRVRSGQ
jgi:hypothetical protein